MMDTSDISTSTYKLRLSRHSKPNQVGVELRSGSFRSQDPGVCLSEYLILFNTFVS